MINPVAFTGLNSLELIWSGPSTLFRGWGFGISGTLPPNSPELLVIRTAGLPRPISLHRASQQRVDPRLIASALSFELGENVRVQPDREVFLEWPIELADHCLAPVEHRRNIGGIDFPVLHPLERT